MCKVQQTGNSVENYYIPSIHPSNFTKPILLQPTNPSVGFSNARFTLTQDEFTCSFRRMKAMNNVTNYFDLNQDYYVLFALGRLSNSKKRSYSLIQKLLFFILKLILR